MNEPKRRKQPGERCIIPDCDVNTGHKSGVCETHRRARCSRCGRVFTWHEHVPVGRAKCGDCARRGPKV